MDLIEWVMLRYKKKLMTIFIKSSSSMIQLGYIFFLNVEKKRMEGQRVDTNKTEEKEIKMRRKHSSILYRIQNKRKN